MLREILIVVVASVAGGLWARFAGCSTGACPLMANWRRGALYGATLGLLVALSLKG